jgi:biopolymer transport protein ExbD
MAFESGVGSWELRGDINVTPLIDVLLVLLIIFMVIVPVTPHGLRASLPPQSPGPSSKPETAIVVQIENTGRGLLTYKINQQSVRIDDLRDRLSAILAVRADKVLFVKADDNLDFSAIAGVMDVGKSAGADRIGLMTSKDHL